MPARTAWPMGSIRTPARSPRRRARFRANSQAPGRARSECIRSVLQTAASSASSSPSEFPDHQPRAQLRFPHFRLRPIEPPLHVIAGGQPFAVAFENDARLLRRHREGDFYLLPGLIHASHLHVNVFRSIRGCVGRQAGKEEEKKQRGVRLESDSHLLWNRGRAGPIARPCSHRPPKGGTSRVKVSWEYRSARDTAQEATGREGN